MNFPIEKKKKYWKKATFTDCVFVQDRWHPQDIWHNIQDLVLILVKIVPLINTPTFEPSNGKEGKYDSRWGKCISLHNTGIYTIPEYQLVYIDEIGRQKCGEVLPSLLYFILLFANNVFRSTTSGIIPLVGMHPDKATVFLVQMTTRLPGGPIFVGRLVLSGHSQECSIVGNVHYPYPYTTAIPCNETIQFWYNYMWVHKYSSSFLQKMPF